MTGYRPVSLEALWVFKDGTLYFERLYGTPIDVQDSSLLASSVNSFETFFSSIIYGEGIDTLISTKHCFVMREKTGLHGMLSVSRDSEVDMFPYGERLNAVLDYFSTECAELFSGKVEPAKFKGVSPKVDELLDATGIEPAVLARRRRTFDSGALKRDLDDLFSKAAGSVDKPA